MHEKVHMKVTWQEYEEKSEINQKLYFSFGGEQILSYLVVEYSVTILNFWLLLNWKLTPDPIPTRKKWIYEITTIWLLNTIKW